MNDNTPKSKNPLGSSMIFKFLERSGSQIISLVINIVLSRVLSPDDYGVQSIILVFASFAQVLVETGFSEALVQKKDSDRLDFSSLFWSCMALSLVIYVVMFIAAPAVARYYDMQELGILIRVFMIIVFPACLNSFQYAKMQKELNYKPYMICGNISVLISGLLGVVSALLGLGVWALVIQQLSAKFILCVMMWFMIKWRPHLEFSAARVKTLWAFSWKLVAGSVLFTVINNAKSLIIGKFYSKTELGYFSKGQYFPQLAVETVSTSVSPVLFSVLALHQDDESKFMASLRATMRTTAFLTFPICAGLALVAEPAVQLILGAKWLPCVPYLRIFCLYYAFFPIQSLNTSVITARGRSDLFLKVAAIVRISGFLILILVAKYSSSMSAIAVYLAVWSVCSTLSFMLPVHRRFGYSYGKQLADIYPAVLLTAAMSVCVWLLGRVLPFGQYVVMLLQIIAGVGVYFGLAALFRIDGFSIIKASLVSMLGRREKGA